MPDSSEKTLARQCSILSVESDSSWQDVRRNYQRLVQEWHPDRHSTSDRAAAQERFIVINSAFKDLKRHYRLHGSLPKLMTEIIDESPIFIERKRDPIPAHIKFSLKAGTAVLLGLGVCLIALWQLDAQQVEKNRDSARSIQSTALQTDPPSRQPNRYEKVSLPVQSP